MDKERNDRIKTVGIIPPLWLGENHCTVFFWFTYCVFQYSLLFVHCFFVVNGSVSWFNIAVELEPVSSNFCDGLPVLSCCRFARCYCLCSLSSSAIQWWNTACNCDHDTHHSTLHNSGVWWIHYAYYEGIMLYKTVFFVCTWIPNFMR